MDNLKCKTGRPRAAAWPATASTASHCSCSGPLPCSQLKLELRGKVRYSMRGGAARAALAGPGGCSWPAVGVLRSPETKWGAAGRAPPPGPAAAPRRSSLEGSSLAGRALLEAGLLEVAAAHLHQLIGGGKRTKEWRLMIGGPPRLHTTLPGCTCTPRQARHPRPTKCTLHIRISCTRRKAQHPHTTCTPHDITHHVTATASSPPAGRTRPAGPPCSCRAACPWCPCPPAERKGKGTHP